MRFKDAFGADRADVMGRLVEQWVTDHQDQVKEAGASITDWKEIRDTYTEAGEDN